MLLFYTVCTCKLNFSAKLKAIQRFRSPPTVGLNRCHSESCGSPQDPLPKKGICLQKLGLNGCQPRLKNLVLKHGQLSFHRSTSLCHLCFQQKKNDWLATIHQTRASSAFVFWDLEASVSSATQTDPVAPRGSSLSITQRNKRNGS